MLDSCGMLLLATEHLIASSRCLGSPPPCPRWRLESHKSWLASTSRKCLVRTVLQGYAPSLTRSQGYCGNSKDMVGLKCFFSGRTVLSFDCVSNILMNHSSAIPLEAFYSVMPSVVRIGSGFNFNIVFVWALAIYIVHGYLLEVFLCVILWRGLQVKFSHWMDFHGACAEAKKNNGGGQVPGEHRHNKVADTASRMRDAIFGHKLAYS